LLSFKHDGFYLDLDVDEYNLDVI